MDQSCLRRRVAPFGMSFVAASFAVLPHAALAEGSRTLYPSTYEASFPDEGRGNLDLADPTGTGNKYLGNVPRRTFIYVYAEAGEHILTGSRNRTSAGDGVIRIFAPQDFGNKGDETIPAAGTAVSTCTTGTNGLISTRAAELAGPRALAGGGNPTGYIPCSYQVPTTGIYGVQFSGDTGAGNGADSSVPTPAASENSVSAWDVTVRSSDTTSTTDIDGRVFTYAWSVVTAGNGAGRRLYSDFYYVTLDGYRYRQRPIGIDPFAGTFFANTFGFLDAGQPLYKDVRGTGGGSDQTVSNLPSGVTAQRPQFPIFFNSVDPAGGAATEVAKVLTALSIPVAPKPPQVNSFQFTYPPSNSATAYVGQGGTFSFTVTDTISFEIVISRNGVNFDPAEPTNKVITGSSGTGAYTVTWNGKDNAGNNFPVGSGYRFRIRGRNGEAHFPFVDVERNEEGGPILTKLNGNIQDDLVYYDDRGYVTAGGTAIGTLNGSLCGNATFDEPVPVQGLAGIDSADGNLNGSGNWYRVWDQVGNSNTPCSGNTQAFGDAKGLNLWTYQVTVPQSSTLDIVDAADVTATIDGPTATSAGSPVLLNIGFGNVGSQNAADTTYQVQLPAGLTGLMCTGATCNYDAGTGLVTITGLPSSLSPSQFTNFTLGYTAPASGAVTATATVATTTSQGANLAPDSAQSVTLIGGSTNADVLATVDAPASTVAGGTVSVAIGFRNVGATDATGMGYGITLPTGLTGVSCDGGITCAYDAGTGAVTVSGLPGTLAAGASTAPFNLIYTAPAVGTVQVTATVSTATAETTTANNSASDATSIIGTSGTIDLAASVSAPPTATPGSPINTVITYQNVGDTAAAGATYTAQLPAGLSGVACIAPATCSYNSGSGLLTITAGVDTSLDPGESASLTVRYQAPAASTVVEITASASVAGDMNAANDSATADTTVLTASTGADVAVTVNPPATAAPGATVNVPVTYSNLGPSPALGLTYTLQLPAGLSGVACSGNGVSCTYASGTGVVTLSGTATGLAPGVSTGFTLSYTAPGPGTVTVEAGIATTTSEPNLANNADDGATSIAASTLADVTTTVSPPPTVNSGAPVTVPVTYRNVGAVTAAGVTYDLDVGAGATGIAVFNGMTACTYDAGTGAVTGCGLPATLAPGASIALTLTYTAPGSGSVAVTSTVGTSTGESNTSNNTATASTTVVAAMPDAVDDTPANIPEDSGATTIPVLGNDTFGGDGPNTGSISVTPISATVGTVTVNTNGTPNDPTDDTLTFTPAPNYNGPVSITYTITDATGDTDSATVTFNVTPVDDAPNAVDDTPANIPEDSAATTIPALGNDSFGGDGPNVGSISVTPIAPTVGTVTVNTNGTPNDPTDDTLTFTPAPDYTGPVSITYTITDADGDTDTATVTFTVTPVDDAPNAVDDTPADIVQNSPTTSITVLGNDTFGGDGPNVGAISVTPISNTVGTAVVNTNGTPNDPTDDRIDFTPTTGYTGPVSITYTITDADGDTDTATVTFDVVAPGLPIANDDTGSTPRDTPITLTVLVNDTFGGDGPTTGPITIATPPTHGTVLVIDGGTPNDPTDDTIRYTPTTNYTGPDTFTYQICDANGDCDTATVTITVTLPCSGNGTVSGTVFLDVNRDGVLQPNGADTLAGTSDDEAGRVSLVSLVPASGPSRIVATTAQGVYTFSDVPEGPYTIVMLDSYLANELNLYATSTTSRAATVVACQTATENFGYAPPVAGVVGDFVWFDVNQSGVVDEYYDADGNNQLTNNTGAPNLDETTFEWVDLNNNGVPNNGEFARCGIEAVSVELLDSNGGVAATTTTNARGAYRFLNLPFGSSYTTRVVTSDPDLLAGSQFYQGNGRCRSQVVIKADAAKGTPTCGLTTDAQRTSPVLTSGVPVADALDFGHVCATGGIGADLQVVKTVSNGTPAPGSQVVFTVTVRNNGPANATNVVVTDQLPNGFTLVGTTVSQGSFTAPQWAVGSLANGSSAVLTMQVNVLPTGNWMNTASVTSDQLDPTPDNDVDVMGLTPFVPVLVPVDSLWALAAMALLMGWVARRRMRAAK